MVFIRSTQRTISRMQWCIENLLGRQSPGSIKSRLQNAGHVGTDLAEGRSNPPLEVVSAVYLRARRLAI